MICKSLKSKAGLLVDFLNDMLHHLSLYGLKTFEQIQAESKSASVVAFANLIGVLGHLFSHRSFDFQALSWHPHYFLLFLACIGVIPLNNFLAGVVHIFSGCGLSLDGSLACAFRLRNGTPMSLVLDGHVSSDIRQSHDFGVVCDNLLNTDMACLSTYMDESLISLGTVDMKAGAAVFFEDIDLGLGVGVSGLVSSTLTELQAIALALECVFSSCSVDLFSDSQSALDVCKSESLLVCLDFRNWCWIEWCHIANIICQKNLDVNWVKVRGHLGVLDNEHADALAKDAAFSPWQLPYLISKCFLRAGGAVVSVVADDLHSDIDWSRSSLVWHPDSHMAIGFTNIWMAGFRTYFIKALHHYLSVAVRKHLYNRSYLSSCQFVGHLCSCLGDVTVSMALCKGFVFGDWYHESVSVYKDPKMVVVNIVNFVREFCLVFHDNIWLVYAKHQAIMEKNKLIPHDGSIPVAVSGFFTWLLAGVIRLLGVANAFGISFGYCKYCLFYAGVGNMASVHISV
ncbi:hypothetical protein G9A89_014948 [Geosiphon pyriformis]|nr:hypothetical protein G9A89_014948 [Geosiphon pyriformis]